MRLSMYVCMYVYAPSILTKWQQLIMTFKLNLFVSFIVVFTFFRINIWRKPKGKREKTQRFQIVYISFVLFVVVVRIFVYKHMYIYTYYSTYSLKNVIFFGSDLYTYVHSFLYMYIYVNIYQQELFKQVCRISRSLVLCSNKILFICLIADYISISQILIPITSVCHNLIIIETGKYLMELLSASQTSNFYRQWLLSSRQRYVDL